MLTAERLRELVDYDPETGVFTWRVGRGGTARAGTRAGHLRPDGYRDIEIDHMQYREHRLAWLYVHGRWPSDQLDHVNGAPADNRLTNLRECTHAENQQNRRRHTNNTSGHVGVSWYERDGTWKAEITIGGRSKHLGYFTTAEEAGAAYREAKKQLHPFQPVMR